MGGQHTVADRGVGWGRWRALALGLVATVGLLLFTSPTTAYANAAGESAVSSELVQQALSLIANGADSARIAEKVQDAVNAPDPQGVDIAQVEQALTVLRADPGGSGVAQARSLLVAAAPGLAAPSHPPVATAGETGTTVVLDEFTVARGIKDRGDAALLVLALLGIGIGLLLSRRLRPHHSIRELRRKTTATVQESS